MDCIVESEESQDEGDCHSDDDQVEPESQSERDRQADVEDESVAAANESRGGKRSNIRLHNSKQFEDWKRHRKLKTRMAKSSSSLCARLARFAFSSLKFQ